jgi:hypothetical protein
MSYSRIISEATGVTDPEDLEDIEDCMRNDIFKSTLDWQTREMLATAAVEAWEIVRLLRDPVALAAIMEQMEREAA